MGRRCVTLSLGSGVSSWCRQRQEIFCIVLIGTNRLADLHAAKRWNTDDASCMQIVFVKNAYLSVAKKNLHIKSIFCHMVEFINQLH